jgi:transposase
MYKVGNAHRKVLGRYGRDKRKQYTSEFKAKVVLERLQRDTTIDEVRKKYSVSNSMIHRWRQELQQNLSLLFGDNPIRQPRPRRKAMRLENRPMTSRGQDFGPKIPCLTLA